ncbi:MAG: tRNA (guanosine(37)-N1)-methyltransferase TrmD [bacterium]|jgi:tRNA (guanine37-N1)-methyltransferase|nr:tRNA (guanosine(37)-N1)-methyltransferase TrmD [Phycisphaerales bacterium]MCE2652169.1 tRNA (guanosine(37)-N1)-methyltransferase TrmD [Planctomycetaceae bacterium]
MPAPLARPIRPAALAHPVRWPSPRNAVPPLRVDILTTFPEMFGTQPGCALASSIPARAAQAGAIAWHAHNIRDWSRDKHRKTDDRPFGGGPGMVMTCQPLYDAVAAVESLDPRPATRILLTPQGIPLTQQVVEQLARRDRLLLIAGHYEGIDERVIEHLAPVEISLGDYVLSGGELGAIVLIDAVARLLPGVLGDQRSAHQDSFSVTQPFTGPTGTPRALRVDVPEGARLLDCPHYAKPREWMGREVPDVLLSGDHTAIERWRLLQRLERTQARRPDLMTTPPPPVVLPPPQAQLQAPPAGPGA